MKAKAPYLLKLVFPQLIWEVKTGRKEIFLSFDDGPHPEITARVLDILDNYQAKATFFCVGHNVKKFPETYREILSRGHKTANHSFNHLNGWKTPSQIYYNNIEKCASLVDSKLFRPPYGRISLKQIAHLKKKYSIVMWSVLSMDYSKKISPEQCLTNSITYTKPGSIVVFHDSKKASENMLYALPGFLDHFKKLGYNFVVIPTTMPEL